MALNFSSSLKSRLEQAKNTFTGLVNNSIKDWTNVARVGENVSVGLQKAFTREVEDVANVPNRLANFVAPNVAPRFNPKTGRVEKTNIPNLDLSSFAGKPVLGEQKKVQQAGDIAGRIGLTVGETLLPVNFLKGTKAVKATSGVLEKTGEQFAKSGAKAPFLIKAAKYVAGKGLANVGEGMRFKVVLDALSYLKTGRVPDLKDIGISTALDAPIGWIPFLGYGGSVVTDSYQRAMKDAAQEELVKAGKEQVTSATEKGVLDQLDKAIGASDYVQARTIIDSIPDSAPFKDQMVKVFAPFIPETSNIKTVTRGFESVAEAKPGKDLRKAYLDNYILQNHKKDLLNEFGSATEERQTIIKKELEDVNEALGAVRISSPIRTLTSQSGGISPGAEVGIKVDQPTIFNTKGEVPNAPLTVTPTPGQSEESLRAQVGENLTRRLKDLETKVLGQETPDLESLGLVKKEKGFSLTKPLDMLEGTWQKGGRALQEKVNQLAQKGLISDSRAIRTTVAGLRNLFGGLGTTNELAKARNAALGGGAYIDEGHDIATNMYKYIFDNNLDKKTVGKNVGAVLDPELAGTKVSYDALNPQEKTLYDTIREGYDLIHDWNFSKGFIDQATYLKHKGKYVGRGYDVYEALEGEQGAFGKKIKSAMEDIYGPRKDITGWMKEHNINDPIYMFNKRLAQTGINSTINDYTNYLQKSGLYSDTAKDGFTKLGDNLVYGPLKGKYVPNFIAEDFKGFFYTNKMMDTIYDVFKMYNSSSNVFGKLRNARKTMLTAYNPFVQLGNATSDNVFGFWVGLDPITLNKGFIKASTGGLDDLHRFLQRNNAVRNGYSYRDLVGTADELEKLAKSMAENPSALTTAKNIASIPQKIYGKVDDLYKVGAFKALLDKGETPEEALRLVQEGFQNYSNVGKLYDFASKTPLIGNAFVKFQGDLIRIMKNALINRPLHVAGFMASLHAIAKLSSMYSGETPEEKGARESRPFIPKIPGLDIPLVWQTPYGELNVARYISPFYAYTDPGETTLESGVTKLLPYNIEKSKVTSNPKGELAVQLAKTIQDPLLGPIAQGLVLDTDFRGKPISDPSATKWTGSTATPAEKAVNTVEFLRRQYQLQQITDVENAISAAKGLPDIWGRDKTVPQALARLAGFKFEEQGPKQIMKSLQDQQGFLTGQIVDLNKKKTTVAKAYATKKIDKATRDARIAEIDSKIKELQDEITKVKKTRTDVVNSRQPTSLK